MSGRRASLVSLLAGAAALAACRPEDSPPVATEVLREGVDMVMIEMDTYLTREGIRRARLRADTAEFVAEGEIHMRPVELTFYDVDGREASVITADFGTYYENSEDMDASGSIVVLDRREDRRLETEALRYVSADDRLYGDRAFTLWEDGGLTELHGAAFESDPGLDSVRVVSPSGQSERPPTPVRPPTADSTTAGGGVMGAGEPGAVAPVPAAATPGDSSERAAPTAGDSTTAGDSASVRPDSTARPDTASAPPDTTSARPGSPATPRDTTRSRGAGGGGGP